MDNINTYDKDYNEVEFISKVNNMVVKMFTCITLDKINEVDHFISDEVMKYCLNILTDAKNRKLRHMFDEFNIATTNINSYEVKDNFIYINVGMNIKYLDYFISLDTGKVVFGNDKVRINKVLFLILKKRIGANNSSLVKKCTYCGANMDINSTGICPYCGKIYEQEKFDYMINSIDMKDYIW